MMTAEYRIVRRENSRYEIVATCDSYAIALEVADALESGMKDGEYLVRREGQPDWEPAGYIDQGVSD